MSAVVPADAFAIQDLVKRIEMDLADPSLYQPAPVAHAAQAAHDAAEHYEQLALMLEAENLAFNMAEGFPGGMPDDQAFAVRMPDERLPQAPPGLESVAPPPGLGTPGMGRSSWELAKNDTETMTRQICWFQNRYHHSKPEDKISPCSHGDDCVFCHAFHPKVTRRNGQKSLCACASHFKNQREEQLLASDTASTGLDDDCSLQQSSSDEWTAMMPPSAEAQETPTERKICYFQNLWYNSEDDDGDVKPCSKGDDCLHCHEIHPKIRRRNHHTARCFCPRASLIAPGHLMFGQRR
eukprot:TRINITY_DN88589_c0_g1_i1.p1 TRINITY_DN88589_c0_g1~~TRINITY_DN88589_c0_g1_i1.p1  ORF type:complete len:295 (+),score=61.86 TRINITY_DN88589_c0_g1_i1:88-972(+)